MFNSNKLQLNKKTGPSTLWQEKTTFLGNLGWLTGDSGMQGYTAAGKTGEQRLPVVSKIRFRF